MKRRGQAGQAARLQGQAGQAIVEYVLLMVVLLAVFHSIVKFLNQTEFATTFGRGVWARLDGMVQCGVWDPCGVETPSKGHANTESRVLSLDPTRGP